MLFLFGQYGRPLKLGLGAVLVAVGILMHLILIVAAGGALFLWGVIALFSGSRASRPDRSGPS